MRSSARSLRAASIAIGVAVALVLAACGGETQVSSSTVATSSTVVAETAPTTSSSAPPPPTIDATTTTIDSTTTTTTVAPTTATAPTTTVADPVGPATAFVSADGSLLEVDAATGDTVRVLQEFFDDEGVFRGGLRLSPDRSTIWFSEGYEDGWYGCDSSIGSFGRIDAATGELEVLGVGGGIEASPNGELISYITSSLCLPDPEQPDVWVLTPPDRVVVRLLETGEEREFVTDTPPDDYNTPSVVLGAGFSPAGTLLVLLGDGRLINVDINGSNVIQDHPVALPEVTGAPVAATADALITVAFGDEGSTEVYSIDPGSGESTLIASAGAYMAVGVSAADEIVVSSFDPVTVSPGAAVTVIELPGNPFIFDIDW